MLVPRKYITSSKNLIVSYTIPHIYEEPCVSTQEYGRTTDVSYKIIEECVFIGQQYYGITLRFGFLAYDKCPIFYLHVPEDVESTMKYDGDPRQCSCACWWTTFYLMDNILYFIHVVIIIFIFLYGMTPWRWKPHC